MKTLKFKTNIKCAGCVSTVTPKLESIPEIQKWNVDLDSPDKTLTVAAQEGFAEEMLNRSLGEVGYYAEKVD
jgi:copper chaperone CopZ